jgi:hypothetical protein
VVGVAISREKVDFKERPREEWQKVFVKTDLDALSTREQVIAALQSSMDDLCERVLATDDAYLNESFVAPDGITKVRLWMVNTAKEQEMVMRAQLLLMERMLGIVPHTTRRQQEAARLKAEKAESR